MIQRLTVCMLLAFMSAVTSAKTQERVETWPDGTPRRRYTVDAEDRIHGKLEEFAANGTRTLLAIHAHGVRDGEHRQWRKDGSKLCFAYYHKDLLSGRFEEFDERNRPTRQGNYKNGKREGTWTENRSDGRRPTAVYREDLLHGTLKLELGTKLLTKQIWKDGELLWLDDLQPFPTPRAVLSREHLAILTAVPPTPDPNDPLAANRYAALRRLQAYRRLCGLPFADLELSSEWNVRCDAAAEVCRPRSLITPPLPAGPAGSARPHWTAGASCGRPRRGRVLPWE
jgi:hypothetical protein